MGSHLVNPGETCFGYPYGGTDTKIDGGEGKFSAVAVDGHALCASASLLGHGWVTHSMSGNGMMVAHGYS